MDKDQLQEQTLLNVAQLAMKFIHSKELKSHLGDIYNPLARIEDPEKRKLFTILVIMYLMSASGNVNMDDILAILANYHPKEEVMQTVADQIRAESRSVFVQEGEKKGELKGIRTTLLNQSTAKFGYVPVGFSSKINAIEDIDTLNALSIGLLKAESLEAFEALVGKSSRMTVQ